MRNLMRCVVWFAVVVASACTADSPAPSGFSVVDSAGTRIASNEWTGERQVPRWQLQEPPLLTIGDPAASEEYELHRVYYARLTPDGRVVASVNLSEIRIYSPDGTWLLTIGRQGEGPGEFQFLWDAHPVGDSLVRSLDVGNRRTSIFDSRTGELRRESAMIPITNPNGAGVLADDSYAGLRSRTGVLNERYVVHISRDGDVVDTVAHLTAPARTESPVPNASYQFEPSFSSTAAGDWIWAGWEGRYSIHRYRADGTLERIIRSSFEGEPVTDEIRQSAAEGPTEFPETPPTQIFPDRLPPWNKLLATDSGWLWVRRFRSPVGEDLNTWDIYDPDGRLAAYMRIPTTGRLSEVGDDHVIGVFRNELDVETIRVYRLIKTDQR